MGRFVPDKGSRAKELASRFIQAIKIMNKHSDAYFCPSPYDRELLFVGIVRNFSKQNSADYLHNTNVLVLKC